MYEYKFVRITLKQGLFARKPEEDYRIVIQHHASKGWRFVQIFDPSTFGQGAAEYFELIFERPLDAQGYGNANA